MKITQPDQAIGPRHAKCSSSGKSSLGLASLLLAIYSPLALAHPGHDHVDSPWLAGLLHPLSGLDHLLLAAGFALLVIKGSRQATTSSQLASLMILLAGGLGGGFMLGRWQPALGQWAEAGIMASLILLAVCLWQQRPRPWMFGLLGVTALAHGLAHATELPAAFAPGAAPFWFATGMLTSLLAVAMLTYGLVQLYLRRSNRLQPLSRVAAGGAVATALSALL